MKQKSYAELLKDPRWQKKRLEIMQRDNFTCQLCGSKSNVLNVHHKRYIDGKYPWEYSGNILVTLCEDCHKMVHINKPTKGVNISLGDIVKDINSKEFERYGIVYNIDYIDKRVDIAEVDSGSGYSDMYAYHYDFKWFKMNTLKVDDLFLHSKDYLLESLFYCFYHVIKGDGYVHFDYFKRTNIDDLLLLKYNLDEIFMNNRCLYDLYLTAENGNLEYINE